MGYKEEGPSQEELKKQLDQEWRSLIGMQPTGEAGSVSDDGSLGPLNEEYMANLSVKILYEVLTGNFTRVLEMNPIEREQMARYVYNGIEPDVEDPPGFISVKQPSPPKVELTPEEEARAKEFTDLLNFE